MAYGNVLVWQGFSPACCISQPVKPPIFWSYVASNFPPLRASSTGSAVSKIGGISLARETHAAPATHNSAGNGALVLQSHSSSVLPTSRLSDAKSLSNLLKVGGLDDSLLSYKENFVIRCYEVGMNRTASIETIANLLQASFSRILLQICDQSRPEFRPKF